jgi:hypothetical protein
MLRLDRQRLGILFEAGPKGAGKYDRVDFVVLSLDDVTMP